MTGDLRFALLRFDRRGGSVSARHADFHKQIGSAFSVRNGNLAPFGCQMLFILVDAPENAKISQ